MLRKSSLKKVRALTLSLIRLSSSRNIKRYLGLFSNLSFAKNWSSWT